LSSGELRATPVWRGSPLVLLAIAVAWGLALGAEVTGRVQWVHHHHLLVEHLSLWASLGLFLVAWQVHIAAMMLPSTLPMMAAFAKAAGGQAHPRVVRVAFMGGYLAVWTAFGLTALVGHALADWVLHHRPAPRPEIVQGGVLVVAGAFQFSALKDRCLDLCRHPALFLLQHYRWGVMAGFRLGAFHGLFCLGCCWALMLVMFVVGIANLAWMAPLALLMLYEKVGRHGHRIVRPVGTVLIVLGGALLADLIALPGGGPHHH
jgi:predicted metal-binding membrane protein